MASRAPEWASMTIAAPAEAWVKPLACAEAMPNWIAFSAAFWIAGVERQHEVVARLWQAAPGHDVLRFAQGVDLDLGGAVLALQPLVVGGFDAALADLVVG